MNEKSRMILVAEDNADHAELIRLCLSQQPGIGRVQLVSDGEQTMDFLLHRGKFKDVSQHQIPHLLLLDIRMPKFDGIQVLMEMKKNEILRKIPVVMLTSSDVEKDVLNSYKNFANSYIVKPYDFKKFEKLLGDVCNYWLNWNHHPW